MQLDATLDTKLVSDLSAPPKVNWVESFGQAIQRGEGLAWLPKLMSAGRGPGKLTVDEFFYYRLFEPVLTPEDVRRYIGKRAQNRMHKACNDSRWFAVSHDKALFHVVLAGAGFRVPETVAVYAPKGRSGFPRTLRTGDDIVGFLRQNAEWPLFAKPIDGIFSVGAIQMTGCEGDEVLMRGREPTSVAAVTDYMKDLSKEGYLFQKTLFASEELAGILGEAVPSLRFLVLWSDNEPRVESAVLKIPAGGNLADNYWRDGNMLGAVDLGSGEVTRVISGTAHEFHEVENHPDTDQRMTGLRLLAWSEILDAVRHAAMLFPGVRTQSWDVALSREGPVFLEFNFGGDLNLHQLAHGRGALTESFAAHLTACGYKGRLS
jgi:hypothetical protein